MSQTLLQIMAVALGGALGAVLRFLVNTLCLKMGLIGFPFATLAVNVAGSFFMGLVFVLTAERSFLGETFKLFAAVGILGSLTTFSTFSLDLFQLARADKFTNLVLYLFLSLTAGFGALVFGIAMARRIWP